MNSNKFTVLTKLFIAYLFIFCSYNIKAQSNLIEKSSNIALDAVLNSDEENWQNIMGQKDSVFINFYEKYTLDNIKDSKLKDYYKSNFKNGLISGRQENFLIAYNYLHDRLEGSLSDYKIEKVIQKRYFDYSDTYERHFDLENFISATILKNKNTGNQVVLISNMVFCELVKTVGLSEIEWYKNLVLKSFRMLKILPVKENTNLVYLLDKYIRDMEKETQVENAVGIALKVNEDDLIVHYFKEVNYDFKLKETFNKTNKIYYYTLLIDDYKSQFEESIIQDDFLVMIDKKRMLYLDKKRKSFKGYYINENGEKQRVKFKHYNTD